MLKAKPQPGDKIRCIDNGGYSFLTKGKIYEVSESSRDTLYCFHFIDDDGDEVGYWLNEMETEDFELVQEDNDVNSIDTTNEQAEDFQIGDVVWDVLCGKGEIISIEHLGDASYPVQVNFENKNFDRVWFTEDGKRSTAFPRSLFFSEPKIEAATTRPFVPTLVGKRVVVQPKHNDCTAEVLTVADEDEERVYLTERKGHYWNKKDLVGIYEVSSENLLKK